MANLGAARRELDRIEGILRTRYHYPHPVFEHIANAKQYLESAAEPEAEPTVPAATEPEGAPPSAPAGEGVAPPPKPKARRARKASR